MDAASQDVVSQGALVVVLPLKALVEQAMAELAWIVKTNLQELIPQELASEEGLGFVHHIQALNRQNLTRLGQIRSISDPPPGVLLVTPFSHFNSPVKALELQAQAFAMRALAFLMQTLNNSI